MKNKKITGVIVNNNNEFNESIIRLIEHEEFFDDLILYSKKDVSEVEEKSVDFLITDIKNIEILHLLKNNYSKKVPIIAVITDDEKKNLRKYINFGIREYIDSEFNYDDVYIKLKNTIEYVREYKVSRIRKIQFDAMLNSSPYMSWIKDKDGNYVKINNCFKEYCGKDYSDIIGKGDFEVWNGKIAESREHDLTVMNERKTVEFNEIIPSLDGYKEFSIFKAPVIDEYEEILGTIGIARDITDLKNKDAKLDIILENIPFAVWLKDMDGVVLNANTKLAEIFNTTKDKVMGRSEADTTYVPFTTDKYVDIEDSIVISEKKSCSFERQFIEDGRMKYFKVYKSPVFDISNRIIGIVGLARDITDSTEQNEEIKRLAYSDYLTGLVNRRGLNKYIRSNIKDKDITIMVIDIDNFKRINDTFGQYYGDKLLKIVGDKLKSLCSDAMVARNSGDEFVIVWEEMFSEEVLKNRAEEILNSIRIECKKRDRSAIISCSIGIAADKAVDMDYEKLLLKGDMALHKAKNKGKNQYVLFTKELDEEMNFNFTIEEDIKKAVENNEIALKYQPQFTPDKELIGFEGLFRWNNEKYKKYPVIDLIKAIEKYDVMDSIGDYVLREACTFAKEINEESEKPLVVFVNISPLQIMQDDFVINFKKILTEVGVNPEYVGIEITETVLLDNIDINIRKIKELKDLGVTIALDDFGTGYSSLNYLVKLPLSKLKIDKSFIRGMTKGNEYVKLVGLIIDISHSLGLPVVAEGVEENSELDILKEMEADLIQGYLFYVPLERNEAKNLALK